MKTIPIYDVSADIFDQIILKEKENTKSYIYICSEIEKYFQKPLQRTFIYNGINTLIIPNDRLVNFIPDIDTQKWKSSIIRKADTAQTKIVEKSIDGSRAWTYMMSQLEKFYSKEEIDECLKSKEAEYDEKYSQFHYYTDECEYKILKKENCVKYDINGAHNDALIQIFPKAKNFILNLYKNRKVHPINKKYVNYFVGMLCKRGYRKTYNWIVRRVSATLKLKILEVGGELLYANTDGFIVSNPKIKPKNSTKLGDFKLEYEGEICFYQDKNYFCFQLSNGEITGNIRYQVRDKIDLFKNKVVHYKLIKENKNGEIVERLENIKEEQL
jgi:hypothetical protein